MEKIKFERRSSTWGTKSTETYLIDFSEKRYSHFNNEMCDDIFDLPDDIVEKVKTFFEKIYIDFPNGNFAFDAPMWTLTIDDKSSTEIASTNMDSRFKNALILFEAFKNRNKE